MQFNSDISERTWYRWVQVGAPRWAIRLVASQIATLDRFDWPDWEIRNGCLYWNQLDHRYFWTPTRLVLPLYNVDSSDTPWQTWADNLSSLEAARRARTEQKDLQNQPDSPGPDLSTYAHNIYYVKWSIGAHSYAQWLRYSRRPSLVGSTGKWRRKRNGRCYTRLRLDRLILRCSRTGSRSAPVGLK
ncbi:MAG: hypothetical protein H6988_00370 [Pseudomonadales bacterium]|nr:hypothetical protein [Pseudomonadales bacterium]MCP5188832.1 hypothetical protein [Pseudomonadales bacterium]